MIDNDPFKKQDLLSDLIASKKNQDVKQALKIAIDQDIDLIAAEKIISDTKQIIIHGKVPDNTPL